MPRQSQGSSLTYGDNMPQNVLQALNMILQSREQRERADVAASLSGMELALREKEMGSMALDRAERRKLASLQFAEAQKATVLARDRYELDEDKAFREKLTQIQMQQVNNMNIGAEKLFTGMFSDLYMEATAGGTNFNKSNQNNLKKILKGKRYGFDEKDSAIISRYILSYGSGGETPNPYAMADLAGWMKEKYKSGDAVFINALVRGGMVVDPRESPESASNWLQTLEGMSRTKRNVIKLQEEWADLTDDDPSNDYTMRPLEGLMDFITKPATDKTTGMGGGGGFNLGVQLSTLEAEVKAIQKFQDEVSTIESNTSWSSKKKDEEIHKLKFETETGEGLTPYQQLFSKGEVDYNIAPGFLAGGKEGEALYGKNIYLNVNEYASKSPEAAVDFIAERRDQLGLEKRDAEMAIRDLSRSIETRKGRAASLPGFSEWEDAIKVQDTKDRVELFRETERLETINEAIHKFYVQADIETERYIGDSWLGAGNEARAFRTNPLSDFPRELLTKSEYEKIKEREDFNKILRQRQGYMYR